MILLPIELTIVIQDLRTEDTVPSLHPPLQVNAGPALAVFV
jgi:hypothetical protein